MISIIVDVFVAVLLISAIGYGMVLNRRIVGLRHDQVALERLAVSFNETIVRAEASVGKLKEAVQGSSKILIDGVDEAARAGEDLSFLIDRGKKLGDSLEGSVRGAKIAQSPVEKRLDPKKIVDPIKMDAQLNESSQNLLAQKQSSLNEGRAETLGNEIIKSQVEREFIEALRAVR